MKFQFVYLTLCKKSTICPKVFYQHPQLNLSKAGKNYYCYCLPYKTLEVECSESKWHILVPTYSVIYTLYIYYILFTAALWNVYYICYNLAIIVTFHGIRSTSSNKDHKKNFHFRIKRSLNKDHDLYFVVYNLCKDHEPYF